MADSAVTVGVLLFAIAWSRGDKRRTRRTRWRRARRVAMSQLDLKVQDASAGERLDRFLAAAQKDLSRSRLQALIRAGRVLVEGRAARASQRLRAGERVLVELPEPRKVALLPESIPLAIVHEDEHLLVVDKPAGLVVHPGAGVASGTLVHALLHHAPAIADVGGAGRPGIVHRLDKQTSGLMVVAKSAAAYRALVEMLRARTVRRRYLAIVWGVPPTASGTVEGAIGRDPRERKRMAVVARGASRPAPTGACASGSPGPRCSRSRSTPGAPTRFACTSRTSATRWRATRSTADAGRSG